MGLQAEVCVAPYQLVYGIDVVFPISLGVLVMKLLQEQDTETNDIQRRIYHLMEVHELREKIFLQSEKQKAQVKETFDQRAKANDFEVEDLVLKWDARREKKGSHGKFDHLWMGLVKVVAPHGQNAFLLKNLDGSELQEGPVNDRFLKHYFP